MKKTTTRKQADIFAGTEAAPQPAVKKDVYQDVTNRILEQMETQGGKWTKPFGGGSSYPVNGVTGRAYNGINVLLLMFSGVSLCNEFASYKQWQSIGGTVRKGEKATRIVFFKPLNIEKTGSDGNVENIKIPLLREYCVFSREQVEGIEAHVLPQGNAVTNEDIEKYVSNTGAIVLHGPGGAYYAPGPDRINMPPLSVFTGTPTSTPTQSYYAVLLHELTHWTGSQSRLDRIRSTSMKTAEYAFEELVAELGAAFQCCLLGIQADPREDHAQYLASWLKALKGDKKFIFSAAAAAQKACNFIQAFQGEQAADEDQAEAA